MEMRHTTVSRECVYITSCLLMLDISRDDGEKPSEAAFRTKGHLGSGQAIHPHTPKPTSTPLSSLQIQAQNHPTVHEYIQARIPVLQEFILQILRRLKETIQDVPYGIRWLCKAIRALVLEKFPDVTLERMNSLIGGFFLLRYINPIIVSPHSALRGLFVVYNYYTQHYVCCGDFEFFPADYRLVSTPPSRVSRRNLTLVSCS